MAISALGEKRGRNKSHAVETTIRTPNPVRIEEASRQRGDSKNGGRAQPGRERVSGVLFLAASRRDIQSIFVLNSYVPVNTCFFHGQGEYHKK
jgi:hypothetical protein